MSSWFGFIFINFITCFTHIAKSHPYKTEWLWIFCVYVAIFITISPFLSRFFDITIYEASSLTCPVMSMTSYLSYLLSLMGLYMSTCAYRYLTFLMKMIMYLWLLNLHTTYCFILSWKVLSGPSCKAVQRLLQVAIQMRAHHLWNLPGIYFPVDFSSYFCCYYFCFFCFLFFLDVCSNICVWMNPGRILFLVDMVYSIKSSS